MGRAAAVISCLVGIFAGGASGEETAASIARQSRERGALNLMDLSATLRLTTTPKDGGPKVQVVTSATRKVAGHNATVARFSEPPGVAGVAVLTIEGTAGEADQVSLYLPKLHKVRKVASSQQGESFMSTDFSYADLGGAGITDETFSREADTTIDGRPAYVIVARPSGTSPYGEVKLDVDKQTLVPLRAEYKDRDGKPLKRYRSLKLKRFRDRTLSAEAVMENLQTGSTTRLEVIKLEDSKLADDAFTERALERG